MSETSDKIRILIGGDCCPLLPLTKQQIRNDEFSDELKQLFSRADLSIVNLECPLTASTHKKTKSGPHLKSDPQGVQFLKDLQVGMATLANNHLLDYGRRGLEDTIALLEKNSIRFAGAGLNLEAALEPQYIDIKGKRIAILNFAAQEYSIAGENAPGAAPIDPILNYYSIRKARENSDFQIVIVHTGIEHYAYPTPNQQKLFRFYAALGVSAVVGHHSHCIGGYEVWSGIPIFYSLGNFFFPEAGNPDTWYHGLLLELSIEHDRITFSTFNTRLQMGEAGFKLDITSQNLPPKLDNKIVAGQWQEYLKNAKIRRNVLNNLQQRGFCERLLNKFIPSRLAKGFDHSYLNILRNESNHEYVIDVLEDIVEQVAEDLIES